MPQEQHKSHTDHTDEPEDIEAKSEYAKPNSVDDILDEIDDVLFDDLTEEEIEQAVASYVQRGGQ